MSKKYLTTRTSLERRRASRAPTRTKMARSTTKADEGTDVGEAEEEGQQGDAVAPEDPQVAAGGEVAGEGEEP